jgi:hypothetical protein
MSEFLLNLIFKILVSYAAYHIVLLVAKNMSLAEIAAAAAALYFFAESTLTFKR